jgi:hypothetical protein
MLKSVIDVERHAGSSLEFANGKVGFGDVHCAFGSELSLKRRIQDVVNRQFQIDIF